MKALPWRSGACALHTTAGKSTPRTAAGGSSPQHCTRAACPLALGNTLVLLRGVVLNLATAQLYLKIHQLGSLLITAEGLSVLFVKQVVMLLGANL